MKYQIKNAKATDFWVGDRVFVVGYPGISMRVMGFESSRHGMGVVVSYFDRAGQTQEWVYPPDLLQHYCYAGLVKIGRFDICLN